jgi:hypothetical protein
MGSVEGPSALARSTPNLTRFEKARSKTPAWVLKQAGTAMASIAPNETAVGPDRSVKGTA